MTAKEQKKFVKELSKTIVDQIAENIEQEKTPETWNSIELRWLLAENFRMACLGYDKNPEYRKRRKAFINTMIINGI